MPPPPPPELPPEPRQVAAGDYDGMARAQLAEREAFFYPPYARLTSLTLRHRDVALLRRGIIIRPLNSYNLPEHLRVSVGDAGENAAFLAAMREILAAPEARRA